MPRLRNITQLEKLQELRDDGYVLVVQDNDIWALPNDVWYQEVQGEYLEQLDSYKQLFDNWYADVKETVDTVLDDPVWISTELANTKERVANKIIISSSMPAGQEDGDIWIDTNTYVDIDDFSDFEYISGTYFDTEVEIPEDPVADGDGSVQEEDPDASGVDDINVPYEPGVDDTGNDEAV